jgi:hypothetical protein
MTKTPIRMTAETPSYDRFFEILGGVGLSAVGQVAVGSPGAPWFRDESEKSGFRWLREQSDLVVLVFTN